MEKTRFPIYGHDPAVREMVSPKIKYTIDLDRVNAGDNEERTTVTGPENVVIALVPAKGCCYECEFCSVKHITNPAFPVSNEEGGATAAAMVAAEIDALLTERPQTQTLKLFNAGNILYGTERKSSAEMNEAFWPKLVSVLSRHARLHALEIEVRIDEFVGAAEIRGHQKTPKGILRDRVVWLNEELKKIGKRLRCILPLEYIESAIISQQSKFPPAFSNDGKSQANCEQAINFMKEHNIEWLSYAMLGGRLKDRSLTSGEVISSASHTTLFGLSHGAREVIINSQYLDPINLWEQRKDGVNYYVPTEQDMLRTLKLTVSGLSNLPKFNETTPRIRLTTDLEDAMEGTIGPDLTPEFRQLVLRFNNATDQVTFFHGNMQPLIV